MILIPNPQPRVLIRKLQIDITVLNIMILLLRAADIISNRKMINKLRFITDFNNWLRLY